MMTGGGRGLIKNCLLNNDYSVEYCHEYVRNELNQNQFDPEYVHLHVHRVLKVHICSLNSKKDYIR